MQTMLSIKIDKALKTEAQKVASALGVSLNAIINQNIKEFVTDRRVTFTDHPMPNSRTQKLLKKLLDDSAKAKNIVGPFETAEDVIRALHS